MEVSEGVSAGASPLALPKTPLRPCVVLSKEQEAANEITACGTGVRLIYKYIDLSASWQAPINIYQVPTAITIPRINMQNVEPPASGSLRSDSKAARGEDAPRAGRPPPRREHPPGASVPVHRKRSLLPETTASSLAARLPYHLCPSSPTWGGPAQRPLQPDASRPPPRIAPGGPVIRALLRTGGALPPRQLRSSRHLLTTPLKTALAAAVKSRPVSHSVLFRQFWKSKKKKKKSGKRRQSPTPGLPRRGGKAAAWASGGRRGLTSLLTWPHSALAPIKSKWFVFNGLLH